MTNIDFRITSDQRFPVRNAGSGMKESEYDDLRKAGRQLSNLEAQMYLEMEYGFIGSRIQIVDYVYDFYSEEPEETKGRKIYRGNKHVRLPYYASTDWNYIRFDVGGYAYEVINGDLRFYID